MIPNLVIDKEQIADFCEKNHIVKLALFGSVLRDDFRPDSDVDVLVDFDPAHVPTFISLYDMEEELSHIIGHKVDMRTPRELGQRILESVLQTAVVQYAA